MCLTSIEREPSDSDLRQEGSNGAKGQQYAVGNIFRLSQMISAYPQTEPRNGVCGQDAPEPCPAREDKAYSGHLSFDVLEPDL